MSGKDYSQVIAAIEQNQFDMLELIAQWKKLIDDTVAQDVTFTFFDGTTSIFPNILKLEQTYGAASSLPTPNAIVRRDALGRIFAKDGVEVWNAESSPTATASLTPTSLVISTPSADAAYSASSMTLVGASTTTLLTSGRIGVTNSTYDNYVQADSSGFRARHITSDYESRYGTSSLRLEYKAVAAADVAVAVMDTNSVLFAATSADSSRAELQVRSSNGSPLDPKLNLYLDGTSPTSAELTTTALSFELDGNSRASFGWDAITLLLDNSGNYGLFLADNSIDIIGSTGKVAQIRNSQINITDQTANKIGRHTSTEFSFFDGTSEIAHYGNDGIFFEGSTPVKHITMSAQVTINASIFKIGPTIPLTATIMGFQMTLNVDSGSNSWYPPGQVAGSAEYNARIEESSGAWRVELINVDPFFQVLCNYNLIIWYAD